MKKMNYVEHLKKRAKFISVRVRLGTEKVSSSRPRDPKKWEILSRLDKARLEKWKKEGKLTSLGKRKFRFRP